jgi:hypothetical protein
VTVLTANAENGMKGSDQFKPVPTKRVPAKKASTSKKLVARSS